MRSQIQRFFNDSGTLIIGTELLFDQSKSNVLRNIYDSPEQNTAAGFIQYKCTENFINELGLRYDFRNISGGEERYPIKNFRALSPKYTFHYKPNSFSVPIYHLIRVLGLHRYLSYILNMRAAMVFYSSNPSLKPESLTSTEIGLKYQKQQSFSFLVTYSLINIRI